MENISRFNWWCPPVLRKQTSFGPQNQFSVDNILIHRYNRTVRCFRCKELGHYAKECTSEKVIKSRRKQERDNQRLCLFITRKINKSFPFSGLDDVEFRKLNKCRSYEISFQLKTTQEKLDAVFKSKLNLEAVIDTMKEQSKEVKRKLTEQIDTLKHENKQLKTKLQKTVGTNNEMKGDLYSVNLENEKLRDAIRKYGNEKDALKKPRRHKEQKLTHLLQNSDSMKQNLTKANRVVISKQINEI